LGLYQRHDSRFWWLSYTTDGKQHQESTKTTSKELAIKIMKQRESEIVLGLFKIGWEGERMTYDQLCAEFERSHFASLDELRERPNRRMPTVEEELHILKAAPRYLRLDEQPSCIFRFALYGTFSAPDSASSLRTRLCSATRHTSPETRRRSHLAMASSSGRLLRSRTKKHMEG
jgi:hypothetical protein